MDLWVTFAGALASGRSQYSGKWLQKLTSGRRTLMISSQIMGKGPPQGPLFLLALDWEGDSTFLALW